MNRLTKTEEDIMQIIWQLEKCFVKDIIEQLPKPKPPYNTISSVVRILEKKGFVAHTAYGKTHQYFAIIKKENYSNFAVNNLVEGYFSGSFKNLVSNFTSKNKLSKTEIEALQKLLKNKNQNK